MNAEILCVGTELLLGDTVNTNAAWLARELAALGIGCYYQTVVGDNARRLRDCLALAFSRADMVVTTGGLGPTYDDLTKETVAAYFGRPLEMHAESLERVTSFFRRLGHEMTENNTKQALMPRGAAVFPNERGTAPGLALEGDGKIAVMLPGPPREMTAMFEQQVRPYLRALSDTVLVSRKIHFFGIGESSLESELREYMEAHSNPTVAPYAKFGEVLLRVTARASGGQEAESLLAPVVREICERYPDHVYGVDVDSLQNALILALRAKGLSFAVAEGFSAGMVATRLGEIPGAADVFRGGLCVLPGVSGASATGWQQGLAGFLPALAGAARGEADPADLAVLAAAALREVTGADLGCAVSGLAETRPGGFGGDADHAGVVHIAVHWGGGRRVLAYPLSQRLTSDPEYMRYVAASTALNLTLTCLREGLPEQA